jgi:methionine-gamma-lyase
MKALLQNGGSMRSIYTQAVHAGEEPDPATGAFPTPIFQAAAYRFSSAEEAAQIIAGEKEGYVYTRWGNPTVAALERKIATLERGEAALATGSGMAAISAILLTLASPGQHIVASDSLYGGTSRLLSQDLPALGIRVTLVDATEPVNIGRAMSERTVALFLETPGNPNLRLADIALAAEIAHRQGAVTLVDSTFATPYCQRPLALGADFVIHSATKYLGGHGDATAGLVVGSKETIERARVTILRDFGAILNPFDAWLVLRGMQTLPLRMERHCTNALKVAHFLEGHPKVARVFYPGLPSHPQYQLAKKQMTNFGGVVAFEVAGGLRAGQKLMNGMRLCTLAANLGDVRTLITHPASMTHTQLTPEERLAQGITEGLIRLSVGIEDPDDIIEDLKRGLEAI